MGGGAVVGAGIATGGSLGLVLAVFSISVT